MGILGLPGGMEWVVILVVVLILFGPSRLPKLGKSVGKTVKAVRDGIDGKSEDEEEEETVEPAPKKKAAVADEEE